MHRNIFIKKICLLVSIMWKINDELSKEAGPVKHIYHIEQITSDRAIIYIQLLEHKGHTNHLDSHLMMSNK